MPCFSSIGIIKRDSSVPLNCPIFDMVLVKFFNKKEDSLVKYVKKKSVFLQYLVIPLKTKHNLVLIFNSLIFNI